MTIEEALKELDDMLLEEQRILRSLDYGEDIDGNPVYEPWQNTFEKGVCMSIMSSLADLQDLLGSSRLSEAEIRERFSAKTDALLKKWNSGGKAQEYPEAYQDVSARILDIRCRFGMSV